MPIVNFKKYKYDIDQVLHHFGLKRGTNCKNLAELIDVTIDKSFALPELLELQRQKLKYEGDVWNEEELKMHFLSVVFLYANFEVPDKMKLFYERTLASVVQDIPLSVICDALLASPLGINTPQRPYFFLQEFKKGKKSTDDAEGQMLIAMLIAQHLNADHQPIYGCYILGKIWYFTSLHEKNYCFTDSFDATKMDDLARILHILKNLKYVVKAVA
jgi:hypothetical protein